MAQAHAGRVVVLSMALASCAALAGCSSASPSKQAQTSRASVLAAAKKVHNNLSGIRTTFSTLISGELFPCGTSDELATSRAATALQYTATQEWTLLKTGSVPLATLGHDIVQRLDAAGWHLRSAPTPNPQAPAAATYVGRQNGIDMRLLEINGDRGFGAAVSIDVSSASCFNAGSSSAAVKLMNGFRVSIQEPRPSSVPSP